MAQLKDLLVTGSSRLIGNTNVSGVLSVSNVSDTPLQVKSYGTSETYIQFYSQNNVNNGYIGMDSSMRPIIYTDSKHYLQVKPTIKTAMDSVAQINSMYFLGTQTSVSITLPSSASYGDLISVCFYSGSTATTLSISGDTVGTIVAPAANQRVEVSMMYDSHWAIICNVMATA